ncbi:MAG: hypothetical protein MI922_26440 [Bacteroidales bacterium]|nr:hypothetical protein [Bacteroidales bacterium]
MQTTGFITKEETLRSISNYIIPGTCVLETVEPYPGYFGSNLPDDKVPESFYIVLQESVSSKEIFRVVKNMQSYCHFEFEAGPTNITIYTDKIRAVRIRHLENPGSLASIQNGLMETGIKLMKKKKIEAKALIEVEKFLNLSELNGLGFKDNDDENTVYITIPNHLSWNHFKSFTHKLRNNLDSVNFDLAYAEIYLGKLLDAVRIFSKSITTHELEVIADKYREYLKK